MTKAGSPGAIRGDDQWITGSEHEATAILQAMPGIGPRAGRHLLERFGSARLALIADDRGWSDALGWSIASVASARRSVSRMKVRSDMRSLRGLGGTMVIGSDPHFPPAWRGMDDPPLVVRCLGRTRVLVDQPMVAVVGSRRCTAVGLQLASRFCTAFVEAGWAVCSGGARGIDAACHRACLRAGGPTVAILGSGLGRPYPPEHEGLFGEIINKGGVLVSELDIDAPPKPSQFPVRNRLVAGLCVGVLLVEAGARSGALITGRLAAEDYGREVLAIPGRVDTRGSAGCHRAVREGWAMLVDEPDQALRQLESQAGLIALHDSKKTSET